MDAGAGTSIDGRQKIREPRFTARLPLLLTLKTVIEMSNFFPFLTPQLFFGCMLIVVFMK